MKSVFLICVNGFLKFINIFYNYRTNEYFKKYRSKIYTIWLKDYFKSIGRNVYIRPSVSFVGLQYITLKNDIGIYERSRLECWDCYRGNRFYPNLTIGSNVSIGCNAHIGCINKIIIEDDVLIGANVFITDHNHGYIDERDMEIPPLKRPLISKGPVIISKGVWIGENVTIIQNINIGEFAIIGANSVVTKDVPAHSVIAGNPARIIRMIKEVNNEQ